MDNMANVVTNEKDVLNQLGAINSRQASTIATQATTILSLINKSKQIQLRIINKGGRGGIGGKSDDIKKCLKYGYFWLHVYKVSHMRPDCKIKKEGPKEKTTRTNTMKGMNLNKGRGK